ncbi:hypothetical protein JZ785_10885 [Alicyclobacillus curvatus]|nr:hypothetical protein JZ785_10885 [Alicyclobacillus curvatus]
MTRKQALKHLVRLFTYANGTGTSLLGRRAEDKRLHQLNQTGVTSVKNNRRYKRGAIAIILVLLLYYVIDYSVVSSNVRSHVKSALATTIQSVGQLTPTQFKSLVGVSQDRLFINEDNRWLVVDPNSVFVKQRVEYLTWSQLNKGSSSPICLLNIVNMSLVLGNESMMVITHARFVGPFGIPRTISVIETQPVKEFSIQ